MSDDQCGWTGVPGRCVPCTGDIPTLTSEEVALALQEVEHWTIDANGALVRTFRCKDFRDAMVFLQVVALLADQEGHHPDVHLTNYRKLKL